MMSSVIPARLEFQCGHAALVTLPRIKGETSAQRNERVAREKSAALIRQCDFCGPVIEVVVPAEAPQPALLVIETPEEIVAPVAALLHVEAVVDAASAGSNGSLVDASAGSNGSVVDGSSGSNGSVVSVTPIESVVPSSRVRLPRPKRARRQRFRIEYRAERILRAVDVRDALRQAALLGAKDVLEIIRED